MAKKKAIQQRWLVAGVLTACVLYYLWECGQFLFGPSGNDPSHPAIRISAFFVVWLWAWGADLPFAIRNSKFDGQGSDAQQTRWVHTLACALCVLHVAIAFHLGHGWSHKAAFDHTEQVSGFGWGIFVNYSFVLVWIADVIWAWVSLDGYQRRPVWVSWLIIGFMRFVLFNAAVVFGHGGMRFVSLFFLACPWLIVWWNRRWRSLHPEGWQSKPT